MTNCPREYKNIGIESFGNRKKVTEEMLAQFCKNDSYLYGKIKELFDLTDPESRKRHYPPFMDISKSYNVVAKTIDGTPTTNLKNIAYYGFDDKTFHHETISFTHDPNSETDFNDYIDLEKSTLEIDPVSGKVHLPLEDMDTQLKWTEIKKGSTTTKTVKKTTTSYSKAVKDSNYDGAYGSLTSPNGTWYCGYNYNKAYSIKSAWKKNPYNHSYKIPSLTRAMTFKALHNGKLTSVSIGVKADKKTNYPLRLEIRETDKKGYPTKKILAYADKKFNHTSVTIESFNFKAQPVLTKGKTYAIVLRCPLAPYNASYHIVGWQKMCYNKNMSNDLANARKNYGVGYSFESTDNGNTFKKYNAGDGAGYSNSLKNPVAFGYELKIKPSHTSTKTTTVPSVTDPVEIPMSETATVQARQIGKEYHLFFKPMKFEKISRFSTGLGLGEGDKINTEYVQVTHHVSNDGKNWFKLNDSKGSPNSVSNATYLDYYFNEPFKDYVFYRITFKLLKRNPDWNPQKKIGSQVKPVVNPQTVNDVSDDNPSFQFLHFEVESSIPTNAYLRTVPFTPISDEMLPACIWAETNAEYELEENTNVQIDVVRDIERELSYKYVQPTRRELYGYDIVMQGEKAIESPSNDKINFISLYRSETGDTTGDNINDDASVVEYVRTHPSFKEWLFKNYNIIICGAFSSEELGSTVFGSKINLSHYVAYPVIECSLKMDSSYLLSSDFVSEGTSLYCDKIYNFQEQIESVEIVELTSDGYETRATLSSGIDEDELKDYLTISTEGYYHNSSFYYDEEFTTEIEPELDKKYVDITDKDNKVYYYYENSTYNPITIDTKSPDWEINNSTHYQLKINYSNLDSGETAYFDVNQQTGEVTLKDKYIIKVNYFDNDMIEGIDYELDYDEPSIRFFNKYEDDRAGEEDDEFLYSYDTFHTGNLMFTYKPLFVRGLTERHFPLRMDLWIEFYKVNNGNIDKIYWDIYGQPVTIETYESDNDNYYLYTTVDAVDNLREVLINEETDYQEEIFEDRDFIVDYPQRKVTIPKNKLKEEDIIVIRYTPDLREFGLSLGFRLYRENHELKQDAKIQNYYFTTRT